MKFYAYSSESVAIVEAKWVLAKFVTAGILLGIVGFVCVMNTSQTVGDALGVFPSHTLAVENNFLRQEVSLISHRTSVLQLQAGQLEKHTDEIHNLLLHPAKIARDTVPMTTYAAKGIKSQPSVPAAKVAALDFN